MKSRTAIPELIAALAKGWNFLNLSVEAPLRVRGWDAIVLTAAGSSQAELYRYQLAQARARGMVGADTAMIVVPDPEGKRIGSGGATLNALRVLAGNVPHRDVGSLRVLMIHAGGDSKRLPWASVFGKPFIPFPVLADPDRPIPTLFDQLLALSAPIAAGLDGGGLLTLTGDVLPLFDTTAVCLHPDAATVITTPASLDTAGRHGVVVVEQDDRVIGLLQKATPAQLQAAGALVAGGAALIDTGIYALRGKAFQALTGLACEPTDPVEVLAREGVECSLYEQIASAFVPMHHEQLRDDTPIGSLLIQAVGHLPLYQQRVDDLEFIHLGSSAEVLEHLKRSWYGHLPTRILAECGPAVSLNSFVYRSALAPAVRLGSDSLLVDVDLDAGVEIGNRCIVVEVDTSNEALRLPGNHCLWQLPVHCPQVENARVTVCCGVDDNPKANWREATFCNRRFGDWLLEHDLHPNELWGPAGAAQGTVWNAKLFPVHSGHTGPHLLHWMLDPTSARAGTRTEWLAAMRVSLADLHRIVDVHRLRQNRQTHHTNLILGMLRHAVDGRLDRNIATLAGQLGTPELGQKAGALAERVPQNVPGTALTPRSRRLQIRSDLLRAGGHGDEADTVARKAFATVQDEVRTAVGVAVAEPVCNLMPGSVETSELPVRFDIAGGWSDTPPYCLERPAGVLNIALDLNGQQPVGVRVETLREPEWELQLKDTGQSMLVSNSAAACTLGDLSDPFLLLRTALVLIGYGSEDAGITQGVRMTTWARVPKGSGLGTSSILGAAVVTALQRLAGRPDDAVTVSDLVLKLEQLMTTGGGWQDQIGGLVPGVKFIRSVPVIPLALHIEPVPVLPQVLDEFHARFVLAFSGQERLAKNVLQIVVRRYLQRDRRLIQAVEGLVALAHEARTALAVGDLDSLGEVCREVWQLHQQLDPHCSNPAVDAMLQHIDDLASGYKLAGAGGGGFMGILAKSPEAAQRIRAELAAWGHGVQVYEARISPHPPGRRNSR